MSVISWFSTMWTGLFASIASLTAILLFAAYCKTKIGGFTGDTLGAVCELAEIIPPLTMLVCMRYGYIT
jgi:adenosylcobinamide-GDP ribazoletransferase